MFCLTPFSLATLSNSTFFMSAQAQLGSWASHGGKRLGGGPEDDCWNRSCSTFLKRKLRLESGTKGNKRQNQSSCQWPPKISIKDFSPHMILRNISQRQDQYCTSRRSKAGYTDTDMSAGSQLAH